jgi:predicted metal-dependent hydrolase
MLPRDVLVRDPQRRWGSCDSSGALRFSWRIVQAPSRLIDYVVVHELVHLRHRTHTPQFWSEVGRSIPDYEALRERLRVLWPSLMW